jgi:hypothetical protein
MEKTNPVKTENRHKRRTSQSLPAPGNKPPGRRPWSYSWTFVIRDRRRRITIPPDLLDLESLWEMACAVWNWRGNGMRRNGLLWGMAADAMSVAWPALLMWGFIERCMF